MSKTKSDIYSDKDELLKELEQVQKQIDTLLNPNPGFGETQYSLLTQCIMGKKEILAIVSYIDKLL